MNVHCKCPAAGFCERHGMMKGDELFARCKGISSAPCAVQIDRWNAWEEGRALATIKQENPILNPPGFCSERPVEIITYTSSVGDNLAMIIKRETGKEIPCDECARDIEKLNSMTVQECQHVKSEYVEKIYSRSYKFASTMEKIGIIADRILHTGIAESTIAEWVQEAIDTGGEPKKASPALALNDEKARLRELAVRAAAARPHVAKIGSPQPKPTEEQQASYLETMAAAKPIPKPFSGPVVWNLIYHIYPVRGVWEWHVERINDLLKTINGKPIIGIVTDATTATLEEVQKLIPDGRVIWIQNENIPECGDLSLRGKPFGEVSTFQQALPMVQDTGDSITIYGHAKGIRQHTRDCESVRLWTEMMYETVLFAKDEALQAMEKGYDFFGSFRTFGFRPFIPKNHWHFSGTCFMFRTQSVFIDGVPVPVQQVYGGVEAWPGDVCSADRAWCSFEDNSPWLRQYSLDLMYPAVVDRQMQWEVDRLGPVRCEQHKRELDWFLSLLRPDDKVLVIGSKHGGLESVIRRRFSGIETLSVDIAPQKDNIQAMVIGSSADKEIQKKVSQRGPFSVVFIDGDHSYTGVLMDWEFARGLKPRLVAFHDIATAVKHRREGCEVDRLWNEIKSGPYRTYEKISGCGWGGIGVVEFFQ